MYLKNYYKIFLAGDLGLAAKRLQRQDECLRYFQKRFQLCSGMKNPSNYYLLLYSESLIEAQVSNKNYDEALITFSKLKIFHLNEEHCEKLNNCEDFAMVKADVKKLYKNMSEAEWKKPNMGTLESKGKLWDGIRLLYRYIFSLCATAGSLINLEFGQRHLFVVSNLKILLVTCHLFKKLCL